MKQLGSILSPNSYTYNNQGNKPVKQYYRPSYHDETSVLKENVLLANTLQSRPISDHTPRDRVPRNLNEHLKYPKLILDCDHTLLASQ